jgi:hypothetical protein
MRTTLIAPVLSLVLGSMPLVVPSASAAAAAEKELKVPAPPPEAATRLLGEMWAALRPELHAPLLAVVADTSQRVRAAAEVGEKVDIRGAARAALLAIDFAGVSKRDKATVAIVIDLVVLQVDASLHAALRDAVGRHHAFRAVRKCAGDSACVDAITPTETMTTANINYVQAVIAQGAAESAAAEKRVPAEIKTLTSANNESQTLSSSVLKKLDETNKTVIGKI